MAKKPEGIDDISKAIMKAIKNARAMQKENKNWMMPDGELMPRKQAKKALKANDKRMIKKYGSTFYGKK